MSCRTGKHFLWGRYPKNVFDIIFIFLTPKLIEIECFTISRDQEGWGPGRRSKGLGGLGAAPWRVQNGRTDISRTYMVRQTGGRKISPVFDRILFSLGPLIYLRLRIYITKYGPGQVMVSNILCLALDILGSQNISAWGRVSLTFIESGLSL